MKFVCPEVDGSQTPMEASQDVLRWVTEQRTNEQTESIIDRSGTWEQVAKLQNNRQGYVQSIYALTEVVPYKNRISLTSESMTIAELATTLGVTIDVSFTESSSFSWRVKGVYDLFRLPYWFTIYTESGLLFALPVRLSTSKNLGNITIDDVIDRVCMLKNPGYAGESGFDYTIAADTSIVAPALITDSWKDKVLNKHKAIQDVITFHLGEDADPLDWITGPDQGIFVIMSKKLDEKSGEYIYLAVRENQEEGTYSAPDVTPVLQSLTDIMPASRIIEIRSLSSGSNAETFNYTLTPGEIVRVRCTIPSYGSNIAYYIYFNSDTSFTGYEYLSLTTVGTPSVAGGYSSANSTIGANWTGFPLYIDLEIWFDGNYVQVRAMAARLNASTSSRIEQKFIQKAFTSITSWTIKASSGNGLTAGTVFRVYRETL